MIFTTHLSSQDCKKKRCNQKSGVNPRRNTFFLNVRLRFQLFKVSYFNINYRYAPRVLGLISCQKLPTFEEACKVNCRRKRILSFMGNVLQAFIPVWLFPFHDEALYSWVSNVVTTLSMWKSYLWLEFCKTILVNTLKVWYLFELYTFNWNIF